MEIHVNEIAMSDEKKCEMETATEKEPSVLVDTIKKGWPEKRDEADASIRNYWSVRDKLTIQGLHLFNCIYDNQLRSH